MFLFSLVTSNLGKQTRHKNLIAALNKKHASRELLTFIKNKKTLIKDSFMRKNVDIHKLKEYKRNATIKYFFRENLRSLKFILDL